MEKKKTPKSVTLRVTIDQKKKLDKLGHGNPRNGLVEVLGIHKLVTQQPALILNKDLDTYIAHMETFSNRNHYSHFVESDLPALLRCFNNTGKISRDILLSILNKRVEKPIDEFEKKEEQEKKKERPINAEGSV